MDGRTDEQNGRARAGPGTGLAVLSLIVCVSQALWQCFFYCHKHCIVTCLFVTNSVSRNIFVTSSVSSLTGTGTVCLLFEFFEIGACQLLFGASVRQTLFWCANPPPPLPPLGTLGYPRGCLQPYMQRFSPTFTVLCTSYSIFFLKGASANSSISSSVSANRDRLTRRQPCRCAARTYGLYASVNGVDKLAKETQID